jgi:hypothetical protein
MHTPPLHFGGGKDLGKQGDLPDHRSFLPWQLSMWLCRRRCLLREERAFRDGALHAEPLSRLVGDVAGHT